MKEVITPSANPFVTSVKKVAPIAQTGETITMKTSQLKETKREVVKNTTQIMMAMGGNEFERDYEELAFDDETGVDYDLDYTVSE